MKRKLIVGAASTLLVGGGLYFGGGSLLGSLSASHTPEPPSVSELYSLANRLPSSKASVVRNEAAQQAAEIAGHPPAPMGSAAYEEGLAQAEALTAAAPPPSYSYGISPGQQPSELGFASKAEWITKYQGNVYGVFGGAKVDPNNGMRCPKENRHPLSQLSMAIRKSRLAATKVACARPSLFPKYGHEISLRAAT